MKIVSDTSPITNLAAIAQLNLLHTLYEEIVMPLAVYEKLTAFAAARQLAQLLKSRKR